MTSHLKINYNNDYLINAISVDEKFNVYIALLPDVLTEVQERQNLNNISTTILARALTASVLLSGNLKNKKDILSLQWNCTGNVKTIFSECNFEGEIRGFIDEPNLGFIEGSLQGNHIKAEPYIGFGEIVVSRKTFDNRPYYSSISPIVTGEIAEDIALYMKQSLQIKSDISIAVAIDEKNIVKTCGGILLMAMPDIKEEDLIAINDSFLKISSFTEILINNGNDIDNIIKYIIKEMDLKILNKKRLKFSCSCNRDKILNILKSLKKDDFVSFITEDGMIKANCQYCGNEYSFKPNEVRQFNESGH
jgi:molecular chaperone Hsp33